MKFAFSILERRDLSDSARTVFSVLLLRHHNNKTGKCNPSYETLAKECGKGRQSVMRSVAMLKRKGIIDVKVQPGRTHTNSFRFPLLEMVTPRPSFTDREKVSFVTSFKAREKVSPAPEKVSSVTRKGVTGDTQNTKNTKNTKNKCEASPSPRNSAASPPPKKEKNGQQGEIRQTREINPDTLAKMAGFHLKRFPIDRRRWKQGDPDPET
jgi:hypothetical protein